MLICRLIFPLILFLSGFSERITLDQINKKQSLVCCHLTSRFGDNVMAYIWAKWLAKKHNLPFCFRPFCYSESLRLYELDPHIPSIPNNYFKHDLFLKDFTSKLNPKKTLYRITNKPFIYSQYKAMKANSEFLDHLRQRIASKESMDLIYPPKDTISAAIHVRKGGGYDSHLRSEQIFQKKPSRKVKPRIYGADVRWPLKFPPEQYYIDQLIKLSEMLNHEPIYAFIFTDDQNPKALMQRLKSHVNLDNITFDCRKSVNRHDKNVLLDFFSMMNFDCLIRSGSNFSYAIDILGDFKIVIFPTTYHFEMNRRKKLFLIMDDIIIDKGF